MRLPPLPMLDQADRRIVGIGLLIALAFLLGCLVIGAGLGVGVLVFRVLSGLS